MSSLHEDLKAMAAILTAVDQRQVEIENAIAKIEERQAFLERRLETMSTALKACLGAIEEQACVADAPDTPVSLLLPERIAPVTLMALDDEIRQGT